jgi:dTMP kinase
VDSRGLGTDRLESESRSFHERVRYAFLDLAAADPKRYLVLDGARPAEEISDAVSERLKGLLAAGRDDHPADASTAVPPGPDLHAPDLAPQEPGPTGEAGRAADRVAVDPRVTHADAVTDPETPVEVIGDLTGAVGDDDPATPRRAER